MRRIWQAYVFASALIGAALLAPPSAAAATVLDQFNPIDGTSFGDTGQLLSGEQFSRGRRIQSTTVGISGTLSSVELGVSFLSRNVPLEQVLTRGSMTLFIWPGAVNAFGDQSSLLGGSSLAGFEIVRTNPLSSFIFDVWLKFDVSAGALGGLAIPVTAGQVLGLEVRVNSIIVQTPVSYLRGDVYPNGSMFFQSGPSLPFAEDRFFDAAFRTFVVEPIPEPGSYLLILAGLGALGFAARRRGVARAPA